MIVTDEGSETFSAEQFDSFDEAKNAVDKGIHDRRLELAGKKPAAPVTPVKEAHQGGTPGTDLTHSGASKSSANPV